LSATSSDRLQQKVVDFARYSLLGKRGPVRPAKRRCCQGGGENRCAAFQWPRRDSATGISLRAPRRADEAPTSDGQPVYQPRSQGHIRPTAMSSIFLPLHDLSFGEIGE